MSERWLAALQKIERVEPTPNLLERAEGGPVLPDPGPAAGLRMRTVVIAAIVAVAGTWAAFAGLRGIDGSQQGAANGAEVFSALWPETSLAEAQQVQERVDAGDPSVQWRTDAGDVALRYAQDVLGWPNPILGLTESDPDTVVVSVHGPDASCSGTGCEEAQVPQSILTVDLQRLVRSGEGGIWSVTAVSDKS